MQSCATDQACAAGTCTATICDPGAADCADATTRRHCGPDGLEWLSAACATGETCLAGACVPQVCTPGEATCGGTGTRLVCEDDGLGWRTEACPTGESCSGTACVAHTCAPGAAECTSTSERRSCNADGLAWTTATCGSTETCLAGACVPHTCTPGESTCGGIDTRIECQSDGLGWTTDACAATESCSGGTCTTRICIPGTVDCADSTTRRVCDANRLGRTSTACASMETCTAGACVPWLCTPGESFCADDSTARTCDASGLAYSSTACASDEVCEAGACVQLSCVVRSPDNDARVLVTDTTDLFPSVFTYEMWANFDSFASTNPGQFILIGESATRPYALFYMRAFQGNLECVIGTGAGELRAQVALSALTAGTWHHIACTRNDTELALWLDGNKVGTNTGSPYSPPDGPLGIAGDHRTPPNAFVYFTGYVDEVRLSNAVIYTASFTPQRRMAADSTTLALWHFDECAGSTAADTVNTSRTGTLEYDATWAAEP